MERPWLEKLDRILADFDALNNPYHNADHTFGIVHRLAWLVARLKRPLSTEEIEDLMIAGIRHDDGHAGITVRAQSPRDLPRMDLSNERYAVLMMWTELDGILPQHRLQRIDGAMMATTFGEVPHPHPPTTPMEKLIAFADVGNIMGTFDYWMRDNFNVLRETPTDARQKDFATFRASRVGFLKYVGAKLDEVAPLLEDDAAAYLRRCLADIEKSVAGTAFDAYESTYDAIMQSSA